MALFTVHLPPEAERSEATADRIRFVRDGFSVWALLLPLPWILVNRLWLVLLGWLAAIAALEGLTLAAGEAAGAVAAALFSIWFAMEARDLKRWTLDRRGWRLAAVVEGGDLDIVERRFFAAWLSTDPAWDGSPGGPAAPVVREAPRRSAPWTPTGGTGHGSAIGLFPGAGGR